jgi:hypothetical protein
VRLSMDRTNMLQECLIEFEVVQDYNAGGRGEKITLGKVSINLAEYVDVDGHSVQSPVGLATGISGLEGDDPEEGVTRRYLMQESKINSTLKIGISMKQVEGDRNYFAPPLKTAAVFGGIAGIMGGGDQGDQDDIGCEFTPRIIPLLTQSDRGGFSDLPSIGRSREAGELQDMYRLSLAASWAAQVGELPPDQCIENIFAGGDGWKYKTAPAPIPKHSIQSEPGLQLDYDDENEQDHWSRSHVHRHHTRNSSESSSRSRTTITGRSIGADLLNHRFGSEKSTDMNIDIRGHSHGLNHSRRGLVKSSSSLLRDQRLEDSFNGSGRDMIGEGFRRHREVDEFEVRDDLVAWHLDGMMEA